MLKTWGPLVFTTLLILACTLFLRSSDQTLASGQRLTALESSYGSMLERLNRIEDKLDRLLEQRR